MDEKTFNEIMRDLQRALLKADIDVRIVLDITESIRKKVRNAELPPGFSKRELILKLLYDELIRILGGESRYILDIPRRKGYIIMLIGIQGSGKTTTVAKLAYFLTQKGYKVGV
ncbi:MAG: signal recognition particle receptor subunit alpha, partial [Candidatus Njordarchaeales archaeon]